MRKCCSISDIFLKFELAYPGKCFANQLVQKKYLLITDERTSVKIFMGGGGVRILLDCFLVLCRSATGDNGEHTGQWSLGSLRLNAVNLLVSTGII